MTRALAVAILAFAAVSPCSVWAQQTTAPDPILHVTVDPSRVVVGQPATLRIDVLVPNYMTSPPELPGFQVRNAVTRQLQSVNLSEQHNGMTYAGVRFEYAIYAQEPGTYAVADQKVRVNYAAEPPATREVAVALPRVSLEAFIPDAAAGLRPFLSASNLAVTQTVKRSSDQLKVGDAVTRTVTVTAEGTPAMLLPPQQFAGIDGLTLYPAQPSLEDKTDGRTDVMTSTRVDSATYMLARPGDYELPAVDIGWWNVGSGKVERARLDAVPLKVAANPAVESAAPGGRSRPGWTWDGVVDLIAGHWLLALISALVIGALIWLAPGAVRRISAYHRRRRQAYLQSEPFAFSRFRHAVRRGDAKAAYFAMLDWLPHVDATTPDHTVKAFKAIARDPVLDREIEAIEAELFAPQQRDTDRWSRSQLLHRVSAARRRLRPRVERGSDLRLPQQLNPIGSSGAFAHGTRRPAR